MKENNVRTNRELYIAWENSDLSGQVYGESAAHVSRLLRLRAAVQCASVLSVTAEVWQAR